MDDDSARVEYNQDLRPLEKLLEAVQRPGDFYVNGAVEIPLPKVEVEGVGMLSFPVQASQIAALVEQAARAPYGRGTETILDETVRKVWQLSPEKVRISGKSWQATFDGILKKVIEGLGCEGVTVSAELYKLLVYDRGGFFLAHRDTEKAEGMFATLVLVLPSIHRGGELVIRHSGREMTVAMNSPEASEVSFAAFYADCEHEVRPILEGRRICLVYNLLRARTKRGRSDALPVPDYRKEIARAAKLLQAGLAEPGAPLKIAWLLEHQYTYESLSFAGLKSADAARVQVLAKAAEDAGCAVHLGVVHIEETGWAEVNYDGYHSSRGWGRYADEQEEDEHADFEVGEVTDGWHYIDQWRNLGDQPVDIGEIPLEPGELLPDGALDAAEPDEQRCMEASGNEGATFERWYRRAALVIWRRERYAEVLLQAGVAAALPLLKEYIEGQKRGNPPADIRASAVVLARLIIANWRPASFEFDEPSLPRTEGPEFLGLLNRLGDVALLEEFIRDIVWRDFSADYQRGLVSAASLLGGEKTGTLFSGLVGRHMRRLPGPCIALFHGIVESQKKAKDQTTRRSHRELAEAVIGHLSDIGKRAPVPAWQTWSPTPGAVEVNSAMVVRLMGALEWVEAMDLQMRAAEEMIARKDLFDPVKVLVSALEQLAGNGEAIALLWRHSVQFILERSAQPPPSPRDWRQEVNLACTCGQCRELQAFARDPVEQLHRFRVRKELRQHLHQQIDSHSLDMTHVTERVGSPQTLVCQKDRRSYRRECERYREDINALTVLESLAGRAGNSTALIGKIAAARGQMATWEPA